MKLSSNPQLYNNFLAIISKSLIKNIKTNGYFEFDQNKKNETVLTTFKHIKTLVNNRISSTDDELKTFINDMLNKNKDEENFELSGLLKDVLFNEILFTQSDINKKKPTIKLKKNVEE